MGSVTICLCVCVLFHQSFCDLFPSSLVLPLFALGFKALDIFLIACWEKNPLRGFAAQERGSIAALMPESVRRYRMKRRSGTAGQCYTHRQNSHL